MPNRTSRLDAARGLIAGALSVLMLMGGDVSQAAAQPARAQEEAIRAALAKWTADFNAGLRKAFAICFPTIFATITGGIPSAVTTTCAVYCSAL